MKRRIWDIDNITFIITINDRLHNIRNQQFSNKQISCFIKISGLE